MKRMLYLLLGAVLFLTVAIVVSLFTKGSPYGKIYVVLAVALIIIPWSIYGSRLSRPIEDAKQKQKEAKIKLQSDWQGQELIVGFRWFKALASICLLAVVTFLLWIALISTYFQTTWTMKGVFGFSLLVMAFAMSFVLLWSFTARTVNALKAGYAIKVDALGLHLSGMPSLPLSMVSRVAFLEQVSGRGSSTYHLQIELVWVQAKTYWIHWWVALASGYIFIFLRMVSKLALKVHLLMQVYAGLWDAPAPTIAASIRRISEQTLIQPVVEYTDYKTLEESRLEYRLLQTISGTPAARLEDDQLQVMYKRFASGDRLSGTDEKTLDKSFLRLDQQMQERTQALDEFSALQENSFRRLRQKLDTDTEHMPKAMLFFVILAILAVLGKVLA